MPVRSTEGTKVFKEIKIIIIFKFIFYHFIFGFKVFDKGHFVVVANGFI
jgi:hypothetical protein